MLENKVMLIIQNHQAPVGLEWKGELKQEGVLAIALATLLSLQIISQYVYVHNCPAWHIPHLRAFPDGKGVMRPVIIYKWPLNDLASHRAILPSTRHRPGLPHTRKNQCSWLAWPSWACPRIPSSNHSQCWRMISSYWTISKCLCLAPSVAERSLQPTSSISTAMISVETVQKHTFTGNDRMLMAILAYGCT